MVSYPWSVVGYFVWGAIGASAYLMLLLLFDKDVAILRNKVVQSAGAMGAIYAVFGGFLAIAVNISSSPDFGPNQFVLALGAGLGWPAIASGIGAGKKVGEIQDVAKDNAEAFKKLKSAVNILKEDNDELVNTLDELAG